MAGEKHHRQPLCRRLLFNRTWAPHENRWQAAQLGALHLDGRYLEACFEARLGRRVRQLGYELVADGKGSREIAGVPRTINDKPFDLRLAFKQECEQELWAECSRLIANCIIVYNASILSRLLEHQERTGDTEGAQATKKICPIAWQHINLQGRFEFLKTPDALNLDAIIRTLTTPQIGRIVNLFA